MRILLLILLFAIVVIPTSAMITSTEPGSPYRRVPEETFLDIVTGPGTGIYRLTNWSMNLTAGTTSDKFTEMSRSLFVMSSIGVPAPATIDDVHFNTTANTYSDFGEFTLVLTTCNASWGYIDNSSYSDFDDTIIAENVTVTGNGFHNLDFELNSDGRDYVKAHPEPCIGMRFGWDLNKSFDGTWANQGMAYVDFLEPSNVYDGINFTTWMNISYTNGGVPGEYRYARQGRIWSSSTTFTCTPTLSETTPQSVSCTDTSAFHPINWTWVSSNGETSTLQNPTFTYSSIGEYDISLTACTSDDCDSKTLSGYISIRTQAPHIIRGNISFVNNTYPYYALGGSTLVRNTSGALYTAFIDDIDSENYCVLAWSTDNGYTWDTDLTDCTSSAFGITTMVDSNDKISMVYQPDDGYLYYRNYTLADKFGDPVQIDTYGTGSYEWTAAIDSVGTVHVTYDSNDPITSDYLVAYNNITAQHERGTPIVLQSDPSLVPTYPQVMVDQSDNVHILWDDSAIPGIAYRNFTASGVGDLIHMSSSGDQYPIKSIIDSTDKIHVLYLDGTSIMYVNTTASDGLQLSTPLQIGSTSGPLPSVSLDMNGTLHFLWSNKGIIYRNLTSSGLGAQTPIFNSRVNGEFGPLYSFAPPGNIPASGVEFVTTTSDAPYRIIYGVYPRQGTIFEPSTSIWMDSNKATAAIATALEMGMIVMALGIVAFISIGWINKLS